MAAPAPGPTEVPTGRMSAGPSGHQREGPAGGRAILVDPSAVDEIDSDELIEGLIIAKRLTGENQNKAVRDFKSLG